MTDPINDQQQPVDIPVPGEAQRFDDPAAAAPPATRNTGRWVIAAVGALALGLLTVFGVMGPEKAVVVDKPAIEVARTDASAGPVCKSDSKANLSFTVKDMNGASVKLADYKGKVLLVNFWATWCPPCKAELPGLIQLYDQYKDKGLVVLGISGDDDAETLRAFASEWKINYPMLVGRDENDLLDAYGPIFGYPISVIVGRDGAVCGRHVGPATKEQFEQEIKALL